MWAKCDTRLIGENQRHRDSNKRPAKEAHVSDHFGALTKLDSEDKIAVVLLDALNLRVIPRSHPEELNQISVIDRLNKLEGKVENMNKDDGSVGHNTNHLKYGTDKLHVYLSFVLKAILCHSVAPEGFLISTIVPIPKANGKSVHDSDNYRGIVLSSVLCKVVDHIILGKNEDILMHVTISLASKLAHQRRNARLQ